MTLLMLKEIRIEATHVERDMSRRSVRVAVEDTGRGVPAAYRSRIFEKFFRVEHHEPGGDAGTRGAGIGLYLCQQIVGLHGGTIRCERAKVVGERASPSRSPRESTFTPSAIACMGTALSRRRIRGSRARPHRQPYHARRARGLESYLFLVLRESVYECSDAIVKLACNDLELAGNSAKVESALGVTGGAFVCLDFGIDPQQRRQIAWIAAAAFSRIPIGHLIVGAGRVRLGRRLRAQNDAVCCSRVDILAHV